MGESFNNFDLYTILDEAAQPTVIYISAYLNIAQQFCFLNVAVKFVPSLRKKVGQIAKKLMAIYLRYSREYELNCVQLS